MEAIRLERDIDLPRAIVWEALVDPVLVEGWLHPSARLVEGTTPVEFREPDDPAAPAVLEVVSPAFGAVRVVLDRIPEGTRGEGTHVVLTVSDEWGRRSDREALWALRLEQLADLVRGHPVDWAGWPALHHREGEAARSEAAHRAAR